MLVWSVISAVGSGFTTAWQTLDRNSSLYSTSCAKRSVKRLGAREASPRLRDVGYAHRCAVGPVQDVCHESRRYPFL